MKKYLLLIAVSIIIVNCIILSSCKDLTHYPHPAPGNVRLASYSLVGSSTYSESPTSNTEHDNYAFTYDSANRLSFTTFTTNNPFKSNQDMSFVYSNDTIYKTITSVIPTIPIERDTFIVNSLGQITIAFTPGITTTFQYYQNLLTKVITTTEATMTTVTTTYTSVVGNFIEGISSAGSNVDENFAYLTNYTNRIGDYLALQSFTMYGTNIYQYTNLVSSVTQPTQTTTFNYTIDAFSNVTGEVATTVNTSTYDTTTVFNLQYENY